MTRFASESNVPEKEISGRHFLFDKRWRNGMYSKYDFRDEVLLKPNCIMPPLPRDYQVHKSNHLHRFALRKELSHSPPKSFGSYEGYDLTSVPAILLPATTPSISGRHNFSIEGFKARSRINNRACSLFTIGTHQKTQSYPDPVWGASASFVQRLSEISSLEGETVRQEKIKKLKKNKKQES